MSDFQKAWKRFHPDTEPVGHVMRKHGVRHWVRFHSLPESQRYPNNESEARILLARQNALAAEVLGNGKLCWLAQAAWVPPVGTELAHEVYRGRSDYKLSLVFTFVKRFEFDPAIPNDTNGLDTEFDVHAVRTAWWPGAFDKLLRSIGSEVLCPATLWMSDETGAVFAPYDGGVDLFLPDAAMAAALKNKHADWLPTNADGL